MKRCFGCDNKICKCSEFDRHYEHLSDFVVEENGTNSYRLDQCEQMLKKLEEFEKTKDLRPVIRDESGIYSAGTDAKKMRFDYYARSLREIVRLRRLMKNKNI